MKNISLAVVALVSSTHAMTQKTTADPGPWGENGNGYQNTDANYALSRIGIDMKQGG